MSLWFSITKYTSKLQWTKFCLFFFLPRSRGTILECCLQSKVRLCWRVRIFQTLAIMVPAAFQKLNKFRVSLILITLWFSWCPNVSYKDSMKIAEIGTFWKRCVKLSLWSWVTWMVKEMWIAGWTQVEGMSGSKSKMEAEMAAIKKCSKVWLG